MARKLGHFIEAPRACSYLPEAEAQLEHQVLVEVGPRELQALLERGWRRFGPVYFRPTCGACGECVPIRVPTAGFTPSRTQRRVRKRAAELRVELGRPRVDAARLRLYQAWHASREARRGWEPMPITPEEYFQQFAFPHPCVRELALHEGEELVGVGICDVAPGAWSAIYFFYDPARAHLSLGTLNVLLQLELARERNIPYVYLGFRVQGCASLRYKASYRPHELLLDRPGEDEEPAWSPGEP